VLAAETLAVVKAAQAVAAQQSLGLLAGPTVETAVLGVLALVAVVAQGVILPLAVLAVAQLALALPLALLVLVVVAVAGAGALTLAAAVQVVPGFLDKAPTVLAVLFPAVTAIPAC